jgi:polysaccharide biosynthesis/export protein
LANFLLQSWPNAGFCVILPKFEYFTQKHYFPPTLSVFLMYSNLFSHRQFVFFRQFSVFLLLFIGSYDVFSQNSKVDNLTDEQVQQFYERARASGMTEMQIEQAAMARGFTVMDIAKMRQRMTKIQIKGTTGPNSNALSFMDSDTSLGRKQDGKLSIRESEDSLKSPKSRIFGLSHFRKSTLSFEPNLRIATPKNYQLGPDDELNVDIFGNASANYRSKITPDGTFKMKDFAPVYVSGLTVEEAKAKIINRLREGIAGLNGGGGSYAVVTLGSIRSIKVTITGEAVKPGSYTVSSLATAFNALYLCGGPSETGSLRKIQVIRNSKVISTIDFYDFLINGSQANNVLLHDQDVLFIPFYINHVDLTGEVRRPAIFETKDTEHFRDILTFAGGFTAKAYRANITLRRMTDREQQLLTITPADFETFKVSDGDSISIGRVLDRFTNRVQITGAVFRPGEYAIGKDLQTVAQLVKVAEGLREDAFLKRAFIYRKKPNLEPEMIPLAIGDIITGEATDVPLKNRDSLVIKPIEELREQYFLTILGEINIAGDYEYSDKITVSDLVAMAGGLKEGAIGSRIEIARRISDANIRSMTNEYNTQIIELKIDKQLSINANDAVFELRPFDIVYIRKSPRYQVQQSVVVIGEINYPGSYPIVNNSERISDLLSRAGGVRPSGYLSGAVFFRKKSRIAIDINQILANPSIEGNLLLEDYDSLYIPKRSETVEISGAVLNPSFINYNKDYTFSDYLSQAGGYDRQVAMRRLAYVTYANGYTTRARRFLFFRVNPKIEPGSVIKVPFKPLDKKSDISTLALLGTLSPIIASIIYLFKP